LCLDRYVRVDESIEGGKSLKKKKPEASGKKAAAKPVSRVGKAGKKGAGKKEIPVVEEVVRPIPKSKMDTKTRNEFRKLLFRLRERLSGQIATLKDESLSRDDTIDLAEDGTDAFDRQFALLLASSEHDAVFEIDEALQRMEDGIYGMCQQCFKAIDVTRLNALPFVKMCVSCQSEAEKNKPKFRPLQEIKGL
jgi:RNA polymerase-binding protein DksA